MEIVTSPSTIVPEVLKKDNYERWSILMQHYLELQDLWEVIQSYRMPEGGNTEEWSKKNALALYAIRISCGTEAFDQIKKIPYAKSAWDTLAVKQKPPPIADIFNSRQGSQTECQEKLQKLVCYESIPDVKQFLCDYPNAKSQQMLDFALKLAITCGRKNMAHYLYKEIPLEFLQGDSGFFLLEHCITSRMFDIALDLLRQFPDLPSRHPVNSTPIILTLAETVPPFLSLSELGSWGRWIYKSTRVKAFPIKPRSPPAGGVGIIEDKPRKWILTVLYKFHLICVMIGLLCWTPACWLPAITMYQSGMLFVFELSLLFVVPLLKPDLLYVLIGVHLLGSLVLAAEPGLSLMLFPVFILLLVIFRGILRELSRIPIGVPLLLLLGAPTPVLVIKKYLDYRTVILFPLFLLFTMPLLISVFQKYKLKLMDEYALEVIRFICGSLDANQFEQSRAVEASYRAIKNGIPEIVIELLKKPNGNILWSNTDPEDSRNMFAHAVAHRQEKIACFLYDEFCKMKDINMVTATDEDGNNILHIAARLAPHSQLDNISGAALQLQSELQWFKSVEGIVPWFNKQKNKDRETPTEVFLKEHKNLVTEAKEWMKIVAQSCTVVGALVITIMFAMAFTVPGGNDDNTGLPTILESTTKSSAVVLFIIFTVSDAISLFTASSSVLMFLGILTSRYACQDFHTSLPVKLIIGLSFLFISIATMMVAFCASLLMMLHYNSVIVTPIILLAIIPVTLFILLESSLLIEIYESTLRPDIFNRKKYWKYGEKVCSCFNRRWWFRMRRRWMVLMTCALFLLYLISFSFFAIIRLIRHVRN